MNTSYSVGINLCRVAILSLLVALQSAYPAAPSAPPAARSELAPTGKLRVGLLALNPSYVTKDGPAAEMQGVAVDLARELSKQLGVPFEPVRYEDVSRLIDGAKTVDWDVAFLGFEPARTAYMDFTAPYVEIGNSFLVRAGSALRSVGDVDRPGHRIAVSQRSVQDAFLAKNIKQAKLVRVSDIEGFKLLASGEVHAVAGSRTALLYAAKTIPGSRILEGSIFNLGQSLAVVKGRPAGTAYAKKFIEYAKSSGLVQQSIDRAGLRGVNVAPPASGM